MKLTNLLRSLYYHIPEDLRQGITVRRRSRLWIRTGVVFIHVPKVAGTSINHALYGQFMGHARASDIASWGSDELKALPSFAVTRNPWDRLVSAYRFARRGRGIGEHQSWVWRPEQYRIREFETFERFVNEWLAPQDIRKLDPIFKPQSLYVCCEGGNLLVDHVGRLENFGPTLDFLSDALDRRPELLESNLSGEPVDFRSFYTSELADLVGRIYEEDVRKFGYHF